MRRRDLVSLTILAMAWPLAVRAAGEKKKTGGPNYVAFNTLTATTIKASGRRGVLTVDCGLEVPDPKLRAFAELSLPRLRAAYVQVVETYAAGLPAGAEPDADFIAQALQRQTDLLLRRPGARVLLGAVVAN